jgi:hypothetical protein
MKPRHAPSLPLTPAMRFALMTGQSPDVRIHGWPALAQAGQFGEPTPDQAWAAHGEALIAEARRAGFEPFWLRSREPAGPAFRRWSEAFLQEHRY